MTLTVRINKALIPTTDVLHRIYCHYHNQTMRTLSLNPKQPILAINKCSRNRKKIAHREQQCVKYKNYAAASALCERTRKMFFLLKTIILKEPGKCFSY